MESGKRHHLVLDDDPSIARIIERITETPVTPFQSLDSLLPGMGNLNPIAAFIDVHLGTCQSGLEAIPALRIRWPHLPVIVLTSDTSDGIIEGAFEAGADDFLRKPIQAQDLKARLSVRLEEKVKIIDGQTIKYGDLTVNCVQQRLSAHGKNKCLSSTALNLLRSLIEVNGAKVSRDVLKRKVWGRDTLTDNALDRKVSEIRKALQAVGSTTLIQCLYGQGYQIKGQSELSCLEDPLHVLNRNKLVSLTAVDESVAEDRQFIKDLMALFLENAPATYEGVLRLIEKGENQDLKSQAHRLKGLACNLAAEKLSAVCAEIEDCAARSEMEAARSKKQSLIQEWLSLTSLLETELVSQAWD